MSCLWVRRGVLSVAAVASAGMLTWGVAGWQRGAVGQEARESKVAASRNIEPERGSDKASVSEAKTLSRAFRKAAEMVSPAVVTISSKTKAQPIRRQQAPGMPKGANPFKGTPFEDFFNGHDFNFNGREFGGMQPRREGMGSGVIVDKSGIIVTNNHVVDGADEVTVKLADGREFKAEDIKTDPQTDLAVLRIKGAGTLPAAALGDSDELEIGDWVIAIGNPFGLDHTVSAGIISGKGRELESTSRAKFLQTDAAINPGNSGGPLADLNGEVVGINTAIASSNGSFAGIGFAIPSNTVKWVMQQLIKHGSVERAYLGVAIGEVNRELAEKFGVERGEGVLVSEVFPDSPAAAAGVKEGDVIIRFEDHKVHSPRDLQERVERMPAGSQGSLEVVRDGKVRTLTVTAKPLPKNFGLAQRRHQNDEGDSNTQTAESSKLGLQVSDMTSEQAESLGFKGFNGVLISKVESDSPAAEQGLQEGMLVMKIGKKTVKNVEEFEAAVKGESLKDGVLLLVRTKAGNRFVVLQQNN